MNIMIPDVATPQVVISLEVLLFLNAEAAGIFASADLLILQIKRSADYGFIPGFGIQLLSKS